MVFSARGSVSTGVVTSDKKPLRHECLRLIEPGQIAAPHPGDILLDDGKALDELVQHHLQLLRLHTDELGGGRQQLVPWQEHMAVAALCSSS